MKTLCNREGLLQGFGLVGPAIPGRSPKPILQNVKLVVDSENGSTLLATDLEVGIRYRVLGVKVDQPGAVILRTQKVLSILRTGRDEEIAIEVDGETIRIGGVFSEFEMPSEDPDLFPDVPDFDAGGYHVVSAADLKRLIRRTIFATDVESTRYALGGVLFEFAPESLGCVGTDGRRLAKAVCAAETEGDPKTGGSPVIPVKALKLIERNLSDDDPPVHIALTGTTESNSGAVIRTDRAVIYTRLVEGRFPRYQDVFPANIEAKIPMEVGALLSATEQASIITSEESRGVDFTFGNGQLRLASQAADVGKSKIETAINYDGKPIEITFDPRYLIDALKTLDPSATITAELIDHKNAAVFRTEDEYSYVVMPLTRER
jgi:DNA polymerase-3 subunit beta